MKKLKNILFYFLVIFFMTTIVVSAEILFDSTEVSYSNSELTSKTTVKGALDELFTVPTNCPTGYTCTLQNIPAYPAEAEDFPSRAGAAMLIDKAAPNYLGKDYSTSISKNEMFMFDYSSTEQFPYHHLEYRYIGNIYCQYGDYITAANYNDVCPVKYDYDRIDNETGEVKSYTNTTSCPTSSVSYTYTECVEKTPTIIGAAPNNYIDFNGETWRIIGVFPVNDGTGKIEYRIKIVRNYSIKTAAWNSIKVDNSYVNEWPDGSLDLYLSGESEGNYYYSLKNEAKEQISDAVYYLGASWIVSKPALEYYEEERSTKTYPADLRPYVERSKNVVRKIGLMYPSDYIYTFSKGVNDKCFTDIENCSDKSAGGLTISTWMRKGLWTITPTSNSSIYAYSVADNGDMVETIVNSEYLNKGVLPVVYLNSDVELSGTGSYADHYKITAW